MLAGSFKIYNAETRHLRKAVSNWFKQILSHSKDPILKNAGKNLYQNWTDLQNGIFML
jgi:hypothetical protein